MLDQGQKQAVADGLDNAQGEVQINVAVNEPGIELGEKLWQFALSLAEASPRINVAKRESSNKGSFLEISGPAAKGLTYAAMPEKSEWEPFLQALTQAATDIDPAEVPTILDTGETHLDVYILPECPFCPHVVSLCNKLALSAENLTVRIADASVFLKEAKELGIRSTPSIVFDGAIRWVGKASMEDIVAILKPAAGSWKKTLRASIDSGSVEETVQLVLKHEDAARALPTLLVEPEFSLHMAVLRVIEDAAALDGDPLVHMLEPLCGLLKHESPQVRGDAAYGLGLLGHTKARASLEACLKDEDEDVRDAVEEALDMLEEK